MDLNENLEADLRQLESRNIERYFFFFSNLLFITSDGIYRHLSTSIDCFLLSCSFPGSILGPQHGSLEMNLMSTNCEPFVTAF